MARRLEVVHEHDWKLIHHTDRDGHHWCPTGWMMCVCTATREAVEGVDPLCDSERRIVRPMNDPSGRWCIIPSCYRHGPLHPNQL